MFGMWVTASSDINLLFLSGDRGVGRILVKRQRASRVRWSGDGVVEWWSRKNRLSTPPLHHPPLSLLHGSGLIRCLYPFDVEQRIRRPLADVMQADCVFVLPGP